MEVALHNLARKMCLIYLDDIVDMGRTREDQLTNVTRLLDQIQSAGIRHKQKKC